MVYKIQLSILFWLFSSSNLFAQGQASVCAVAFYNFENLYDTADDPRNWGDNEFLPKGLYNYTSTVYHKKLHNLAIVISQLGVNTITEGPVIIGTAEIENSRVLEDLIQEPEIKGRYNFVHFDSRDSRGTDVAMLYNPKYFKVLGARALFVDLRNKGEMKGGKTRDILYVNGVLGDDTMHVFVNHWPSRRGGEAATSPLRTMAAAAGKAVIDSLMSSNSNVKIIFMGDLNDDPVNESITKVLGAKGRIGKVGLNGLYNPWMDFYKKGYGTLGFDDRWNLFDQIIISGSFLKRNNTGGKQWAFYKSEVFKKDYMLEKFGPYKGYPKRSFSNNQWNDGYSDHLPTLIYLIEPK